MTKPILQTADIFFTDNFSTEAKIVKFLMTAPTIWQHLWRKIRGTQDEVRFYHAGLIIDQDTMIEQQSDVRIRDTDRIFRKNYVVWRNKKLGELSRNFIVLLAKEDVGKGYDIVLCIGKTFTWLTGIPIFTRWVQAREKEICVTRVAKWYKLGADITFGTKTWHEITTDIIDDYCLAHPKEWEQIAIKY